MTERSRPPLKVVTIFQLRFISLLGREICTKLGVMAVISLPRNDDRYLMKMPHSTIISWLEASMIVPIIAPSCDCTAMPIIGCEKLGIAILYNSFQRDRTYQIGDRFGKYTKIIQLSCRNCHYSLHFDRFYSTEKIIRGNDRARLYRVHH